MRDRLLAKGTKVLAAKLQTVEAALLEERRRTAELERAGAISKATADLLSDRVDRYHYALSEIAEHPLVERNPDGVDQAAYSMRLIAQDALAPPEPGDESPS